MNVAIKKENNHLLNSSKDNGQKQRFPLRTSNNKSNTKNTVIDHVPVTRSMRKQSTQENANFEERSPEPVKRQLSKRTKKQKVKQIPPGDENRLETGENFELINYKTDDQVATKTTKLNNYVYNPFTVGNLQKDDTHSIYSSIKDAFK